MSTINATIQTCAICGQPNRSGLPSHPSCAYRREAESPESDVFTQLDRIAAALESGETVTIEPGSVKAARIHDAIAKAKGGAA